jgi:hypothetical protein
MGFFLGLLVDLMICFGLILSPVKPHNMKSHKITLCALILLAPFLFSYDDGVAEHQNKDRTGAPGSNAHCGASCHDDNQFAPELIIELIDQGSNEAVAEYLAGQTYEIRYTIEHGTGSPSVFGFQSTVLLSNNSNAGTFSMPGMDVQLEDVNGRHIIEHSMDSPSNVFTADWTAPQEGSGSVTFYASSVACNNNNANSGDGFDGAVLAISEGTAISVSEIELGAFTATVQGSQLLLNHLPLGSIMIYNLNGQLADQRQSYAPQMQLDLSGKSGIYIIVVQSEYGIQSQKVLIF